MLRQDVYKDFIQFFILAGQNGIQVDQNECLIGQNRSILLQCSAGPCVGSGSDSQSGAPCVSEMLAP